MDCLDLQQIAHSVSLVEECDIARNGALRMCTPFLYPDGSNVDVFLEHRRSSIWDHYVLSDYGQTAIRLHDEQVKLSSTLKKREAVKEICGSLGVILRGGSLEIEFSEVRPTDISSAVMRLSQACIRISDFIHHQRLRSINPFRDDIEEFLDAENFLRSLTSRSQPQTEALRLTLKLMLLLLIIKRLSFLYYHPPVTRRPT